jgi:hypothetical protein
MDEILLDDILNNMAKQETLEIPGSFSEKRHSTIRNLPKRRVNYKLTKTMLQVAMLALIIISLTFSTVFIKNNGNTILVNIRNLIFQEQKEYRITTPVDGLYWGMDEKTAVEILKLKDYKTGKIGDSMVYVATEENYNFYGAKVSLRIYFNYDMLSGFAAKISEEDLDTVEKNLTNELGKGHYDYSVNWDSSVKDVLSIVWCDTFLKDKPEYLERIKKVYEAAGYNTSEMRFNKLGDRALITYELFLDKKSPKYGLLSIDGSLASMLNYSDINLPK